MSVRSTCLLILLFFGLPWVQARPLSLAVTIDDNGRRVQLSEVACLFNDAIMNQHLRTDHVLYQIVSNYLADMCDLRSMIDPPQNTVHSFARRLLGTGQSKGQFGLLRGACDSTAEASEEHIDPRSHYAATHNIWLPGHSTVYRHLSPPSLESGVVAADLANAMVSMLQDTNVRGKVAGTVAVLEVSLVLDELQLAPGLQLASKRDGGGGVGLLRRVSEQQAQDLLSSSHAEVLDFLDNNPLITSGELIAMQSTHSAETKHLMGTCWVAGSMTGDQTLEHWGKLIRSIHSTCLDCCIDQADAGAHTLRPCGTWCDACAQSHHLDPSGAVLCVDCRTMGHVIVNPAQRPCGRRKYTVRVRPVFLGADSCGSNLKALSTMQQGEAHWHPLPFPDVVHLAKSIFTSQVNWWVMVDGHATSQLVQHAVHNSSGELGDAVRKAINFADLRAKDRQSSEQTCRIGALSELMKDHANAQVVAVIVPSLFFWNENRSLHDVACMAVQGSQKGGKFMTCVCDQEGLHSVNNHQPASVMLMVKHTFNDAVGMTFGRPNTVFVLDKAGQLWTANVETQGKPVQVKITSPNGHSARNLSQVSAIGRHAQDVLVVGAGSRVVKLEVSLTCNSANKTVKRATAKSTTAHTFASTITAMAGSVGWEGGCTYFALQNGQVWKCDDTMDSWVHVITVAGHRVDALCVKGDGGLAWCTAAEGEVWVWDGPGAEATSIGGRVADRQNWRPGLRGTAKMPGVRCLAAVEQTVWAGGGSSVAVVTKLRGAAHALGAIDRLAAAWGLHEHAGVCWDEAERLLQHVHDSLTRWAEQSRLRSGNPVLADGPYMAHSGPVRNAMQVLLSTMKMAEAWHTDRGLDGSSIRDQPVRHLTTMVVEGVFGEATVGHGTGAMTVLDFAREYRRITGNITDRGAHEPGYSSPAMNRSHSKKVDLACRGIVETDPRLATASNVKKAQDLHRLSTAEFSDEHLRAVSHDLLQVAQQVRVRAHTKERAGSNPLALHHGQGDRSTSSSSGDMVIPDEEGVAEENQKQDDETSPGIVEPNGTATRCVCTHHSPPSTASSHSLMHLHHHCGRHKIAVAHPPADSFVFLSLHVTGGDGPAPPQRTCGRLVLWLWRRPPPRRDTPGLVCFKSPRAVCPPPARWR